jgi:hypothetical protein
MAGGLFGADICAAILLAACLLYRWRRHCEDVFVCIVASTRCCGSGSRIRCFFYPGIRDGKNSGPRIRNKRGCIQRLDQTISLGLSFYPHMFCALRTKPFFRQENRVVDFVRLGINLIERAGSRNFPLWSKLQMGMQCCGSGMIIRIPDPTFSIPDPNFFPSRIRIFSIPDPHKRI